MAQLINSSKANIYLFIGAALYCFISYAQTWGTGWTFDDVHILQGLGSITDYKSIIDFLTKADTGSLTGRPLAVATFFLNVDDWPSSPSGFRRINSLIHIFNACLLTWISFQVAKLIPSLKTKAVGFSVSLGLIWMLHPFLASTSFHLIQRMTLVAATFSLLGILLYLYGRSWLSHRPALGFTCMSVGMVLAGGIGFFAKENAALTPIMVAVAEFTLLNRFAPIKHKYIDFWRMLFFLLPAIIIAVYFIYYLLVRIPSAYDLRRFSFIERLFSEPIILLEYVQQIFVPNILSMGPYQNDLARIHSIDLLSLSALCFWIAAVLVSLVYRKRWPLFSFSILFFLAGHLLESTIINLELYFEHRNYLPSAGLLAGAVGATWINDKVWPKYLTYAYAAVMAVLLWQLNTLWGDPFKSVHTWAEMHPTSSRAVQNLPTFYQRLGNYDAAAKIVLNNYRNDPKDGGFAAYVLISKCFSKDKTSLNNEIKQIISDAPLLHFSESTTGTLQRMTDLVASGNCPLLAPSKITSFLQGLINNPKYRADKQQHDILFAWARVLKLQGKRSQAVELKIKGYRLYPTTRAAKSIYSELTSLGQPDRAKQFILETEKKPDNTQENP